LSLPASRLSLFDIAGNKIRTARDIQHLSVSDLSGGIYILEVENENEVRSAMKVLIP
jgi:hypothetical protein